MQYIAIRLLKINVRFRIGAKKRNTPTEDKQSAMFGHTLTTAGLFLFVSAPPQVAVKIINTNTRN